VESEATTTRVNLIADGGADEAHPVNDANLMGLNASAIGAPDLSPLSDYES
jgi:hypothetical protein